jgi:lambda family phage portal protein
MKEFFPTFRRWLGLDNKPRTAQRAYEGAQGGRLTMNWIFSGLSANEELKVSLKTLRERCRESERNDDHARAFLGLLENNVLGEGGIGLQMKVKDLSGKLDELANDRIEWAWWKWGRPGLPTVCGRHGWRDLQAIVLRSLARDGEVLVRKHAGWAGNKHGFALEVLEADYLDESYNLDMGERGRIVMGVEMDSYGRPVAYHLLGTHPGDVGMTLSRKRIPASEILHLFIAERPGQVRGVPWMASALHGLKMLRGYKEAELVAARTAAAKLGFLKRTGDTQYEGSGTGDDGNRTMDAQAGTITELPNGLDFVSWDPTHPTQAFPDFVKAVLRGVSAGLRVSYNSLASDLEGVNYSSIRAGLLEEREAWKCLQRFFIEHFCEKVFEDWLKSSLSMGAIEVVNGTLPASKFEKFHAPEFRGRRWPWVDPKKDIEASMMAIDAGLTSRRAAIGEAGGDIYEIFREQQADKELAAEMGLSFDTEQKTNAGPQKGNAPAGADD